MSDLQTRVGPIGEDEELLQMNVPEWMRDVDEENFEFVDMVPPDQAARRVARTAQDTTKPVETQMDHLSSMMLGAETGTEPQRIQQAIGAYKEALGGSTSENLFKGTAKRFWGSTKMQAAVIYLIKHMTSQDPADLAKAEALMQDMPADEILWQELPQITQNEYMDRAFKEMVPIQLKTDMERSAWEQTIGAERMKSEALRQFKIDNAIPTSQYGPIKDLIFSTAQTLPQVMIGGLFSFLGAAPGLLLKNEKAAKIGSQLLGRTWMSAVETAFNYYSLIKETYTDPETGEEVHFDPTIAAITSALTGIFNGQIEFIQWETIGAPMAKFMQSSAYQKAAGAAIRRGMQDGSLKSLAWKIAKRHFKQFPGHYGSEILEEIIQGMASWCNREIAVELNNRIKGTEFEHKNWRDLLQQSLQTTGQAAKGFLLLMVAPEIFAGVQEYRAGKKLTIAPRVPPTGLAATQPAPTTMDQVLLSGQDYDTVVTEEKPAVLEQKAPAKEEKPAEAAKPPVATEKAPEAVPAPEAKAEKVTRTIEGQEYEFEEPPAMERGILAIRLRDGRIVADPGAKLWVDVADSQRIQYSDAVEVGRVVNGIYMPEDQFNEWVEQGTDEEKLPNTAIERFREALRKYDTSLSESQIDASAATVESRARAMNLSSEEYLHATFQHEIASNRAPPEGSLQQLTGEEQVKFNENAKGIFGTWTSEDRSQAGWVLSDGTVINKSGISTESHRLGFIPALGIPELAYLQRMEEMGSKGGAIRYNDEFKAVQAYGRPTDEQLRTIEGLLKGAEKATLEISDEFGNMVASQEVQRPGYETLRRFFGRSLPKRFYQGGPGEYDMRRLGQKAIDFFGITHDPLEAGYILPDGTMLDMSGRSRDNRYERAPDGTNRLTAESIKREGTTDWLAGRRGLTHYYLFGEMKDQNPLGLHKRGMDSMIEFMQRSGAVRVDAEAGATSVAGPPSAAQIRAMAQAMAQVYRRVPGETPMHVAYLDVLDDKGNAWSAWEIHNPTLEKLQRVFANLQPGVHSVRQTGPMYHGSGAAFEQFRSDYIGTGQGSTTFGWGLYFTSKEQIAKEYAEMQGMKPTSHVSGVNQRGETFDYEADDIQRLVADSLDRWRAGKLTADDLATVLQNEIQRSREQYVMLDSRLKETLAAKERLGRLEEYDYRVEQISYERDLQWQYINTAANILSALRTKTGELKWETRKTRHVYEVALHNGKQPAEYVWLDWYARLPSTAWDKIERQAKQENMDWLDREKLTDEEKEGQHLYRLISEYFVREAARRGQKAEWRGKKDASLFLLRAGVDGVKYPTASIMTGNRNYSLGTNYVVFDDRAVTVSKHVLYQDPPDWSLRSPQVIREKMSGPMTGQQILAMLRNNGVKEDEIQLSGLDEFLKEDVEKTPAELIKFIDEKNPGQYLWMRGKGAVSFAEDGKALLHVCKYTDFSTVIHELGHIWRRQLHARDIAVIERFLGVRDHEWDEEAEEKFANMTEQFVRENVIPTPELRPLFGHFHDWLKDIYERFGQYNFTPEVRETFEGLFIVPKEREVRALLRPLEEGEAERILQAVADATEAGLKVQGLNLAELRSLEGFKVGYPSRGKVATAEEAGGRAPLASELRRSSRARDYLLKQIERNPVRWRGILSRLQFQQVQKLGPVEKEEVAQYELEQAVQEAYMRRKKSIEATVGEIMGLSEEEIKKAEGPVYFYDETQKETEVQAAPGAIQIGPKFFELTRSQKMRLLKSALSDARKEARLQTRLAIKETKEKEREKTKARFAKHRETETKKRRIDQLKEFMHSDKYKQMIPELREPIDRILSGIDMLKMTKDYRAQLQALIARMDMEDWKGYSELTDKTKDEILRLEATNIHEMTGEQVDALYQTIMEYSSIADELHSIQVGEERQALDQAVKVALGQMKEPKVIAEEWKTAENKPIKEAVLRAKDLWDTFLGIGQEHWDLIVEKLAGIHSIVDDVLNWGISKGRNTALKYEQEIATRFQERIDEIGIENVWHWLQEEMKFEAKKLKITLRRDMVLSLYMHSQNEDNWRCFLEKGFGFKYKTGERNRIYQAGEDYVAEDLEEIVASLTPEEQQFCDIVGDMLAEQGKDITLVFRDIHGYDPPLVEAYWHKDTMAIGRRSEAQEEGIKEMAETAVLRPGPPKGWLIPRTGAAVPLYLNGIAHDFWRSVTGVAAYVGFEKPMRQATKLLNHAELKSGLIERYGDRTYRELRKGLRDVVGEQWSFDDSERFWMKLRRNMITVYLGFNPTTPLKQPLQLANAAVYVKPDYLFRAALEVAAHPKKIRQMHEMYSPKFADRARMGFTRDIAEYNRAKAARAFVGGRLDWRQLSMYAVRFMDIQVVSTVYLGTINQVLDEIESGQLSDKVGEVLHLDAEKAAKLNADEKIAAAYQYADYTVSRTQDMALPEHRSPLSRGGPLARFFTMFGASTNQNWNLVKRMVIEAARNPTPKTLGRAALAMFSVFVIQAVAEAGIDTLRDRLRRREKKDYDFLWRAIMSASGSIYFLRDIADGVRSAVQRNWGSDIQIAPTRILNQISETIYLGFRILTENKTVAKRRAARNFVDNVIDLIMIFAEMPLYTPKSWIKDLMKEARVWPFRSK